MCNLVLSQWKGTVWQTTNGFLPCMLFSAEPELYKEENACAGLGGHCLLEHMGNRPADRPCTALLCGCSSKSTWGKKKPFLMIGRLHFYSFNYVLKLQLKAEGGEAFIQGQRRLYSKSQASLDHGASSCLKKQRTNKWSQLPLQANALCQSLRSGRRSEIITHTIMTQFLTSPFLPHVSSLLPCTILESS